MRNVGLCDSRSHVLELSELVFRRPQILALRAMLRNTRSCYVEEFNFLSLGGARNASCIFLPRLLPPSIL